MHGIESSDTRYGDRSFGSTRYDEIGFAQTYIVICVDEGVGRRCTCRYDTEVGSPETVYHGYLSCGDVCNHFRDKERVEPRPFFGSDGIIPDFLLKRADSADTCREDNAGTIFIDGFEV